MEEIYIPIGILLCLDREKEGEEKRTGMKKEIIIIINFIMNL